MDDSSTKELLDIPVAMGISGEQVTRTLDAIAAFRGYPKVLEPTRDWNLLAEPTDQWAYRHGVELKLIQLGKPMQNGYVESFNGKFQCSCLNEHWFRDLAHAPERRSALAPGLQRAASAFILGIPDTLEFASALSLNN